MALGYFSAGLVTLIRADPIPREAAGGAGGAGGAGAEPAVPDAEPIPASVLEARREQLFERLKEGIAVIRSADRRAYDEYPQDSDFRQDNNFYYLTGLETPASWLVMFSRSDGRDSVVLFVPERDPSQEIWTGSQVGPAEVKKLTGIKSVYPSSEFEKRFLRQLARGAQLAKYTHLYLLAGVGVPGVREIVDLGLETHRSISDLGEPLAELRQVKDSVELARLRRAAWITGEAQREAMRSARPGMYEYELEALIEYVFRLRGAERVGFPSIVGSGPNSVILHHDKNRRRMEDGDLVVVDVGAEFEYYTADVTRTFPVNGKFSERQREVYELVLATQEAVLEAIRPGVTMRELRAIADRYLREHSSGLCGRSGCQKYFVHGLGHWLGMDVHDVGSYTSALEPGMVLTVEPGIYLAEEGLGVRIEDDVLVTEEGHEVLSKNAPRTVWEIEDLMGRAP